VEEGVEGNKDHMGNREDKDQEDVDQEDVDQEDKDQEDVDREDVDQEDKDQVGDEVYALDIDDHRIYEYFF
jgi:hypothetical protein